ncbi:pantoate--beta-alanine ligase [Bradyrhizobium sp. CCBAU 21362]|uniref:4-phosphopantoate--beta-alanine ligase n=1 Tax=Bradyrhizobium sp. CCBAU 21362 TaxID=1325082 RepID=UPI002306253C|nr:pantoate--beta-alanine ligase [Bradyrhizobium sp. CCBAU 21362]MDA9535748.1 pantoate--beta-alanine ligase [Bradyrhizobium sp. CCBAU 21362]
MQTIATVAELRRTLAKARSADQRVGFVPTMGYLHDGHLALIAASQGQCDVTVVSIFVNPTQFGPNEDLSTYPRDFLRDEGMAVDLNLPIEIVTVPTVREQDGLAMSSRNRYLSKEERQRALTINRGLSAALDEFRSGERNVERLIAIAKGHLEAVDRLQYLELVDGDTLNTADSPLRRPAALCAAAYVGSTRLIDNVILASPTP